MQLRGTHLYIKYLREKIYNNCNNVALFWNFYQLPRIVRNFSKHHYKCKTVLTNSIAREETANIKIFTGKPTKQFCFFLWLKSRSARGTSHHPAFMGNCQTISHKFYTPIYPVDEGNDDVGSVSEKILLFLELFDFQEYFHNFTILRAYRSRRSWNVIRIFWKYY